LGQLKNQRHELFAQHIASGKNGYEAYVLCGYVPSRFNASRLKTSDNVQRRIMEILSSSAERVEVDRAWVLKRLAEQVDRSMAVVVDEEGVRPAATYHPAAANKALELLGREVGMFQSPERGGVVQQVNILITKEDEGLF
jgi:hypothetical protein